MIRRIYFSLLTSSEEIHNVFGDRIYAMGAVPAGATLPFVVIKFLDTDPGPAVRVERRDVENWMYGPDGDFTVIERGMAALKVAAHDKYGNSYTDPDYGKVTLISSMYTGSGPDLRDDQYRASCKVATYRVVGGTA